MQQDWDIELPDLDPNHSMQALLGEMMETRSTLLDVKQELNNGRHDRALELCGSSMLILSEKKRLSSYGDEQAITRQKHLFDAAVMLVKGNLPIKSINATLNLAAEKFIGTNMFTQTGYVYNSAPSFCITLADALERCVADQLSKAMDAGNM
eukprot:6004241-Karenia_brevis.AAC.1